MFHNHVSGKYSLKTLVTELLGTSPFFKKFRLFAEDSTDENPDENPDELMTYIINI